ncbi:MAG: DUF58 domain-containing protein [Candidatus Sericytochromatia bacterium]|nr:DUF58 domain-containing protein [Candidatus Sericytochromatia bacterium]
MTLQAWVQLVLSVAMLAAAYQTQTGWLFVMGSVGFGGLLVAWGAARWNLAGVALSTRPPEPVERGGWLLLPLVAGRERPGPAGSLEVLVPERWPRWHEGLARDALIPAGWSYATLHPTPGKPAMGVLRVPALHRGEHPLPRLLLQSSWPLGLVALWRPLQPPETMLVYPRTPHVEQLPWLEALGPEQAAVARLTPEVGAWLRGVREHRPGETVRGLHWPTVARTGKLHVRDTEREAGDEVVLWLDLRRDAHTPETLEHMLEVAAALVDLCARQGRGIRLTTQPEVGLPDARGSREEALCWLARAEARAEAQASTGPPGALALSPSRLPGWGSWAAALVWCPAADEIDSAGATACCPVGRDIATTLTAGGPR